MGLFDNAVEVVINNKVVQSIKTLNGGVLYEKGNGTFLTIDVPLNLVYSDAFNITGTLKDSNHTGVVGETVKLKVGSTVVDTTTTTTGGAYSFTQTPVATGNHSFQVVYEGSVDYNASESTVVNRVVGKETTVLSVTSPVDNYLTYNANIPFVGTLTDDDGTPLSGKTISIYDGYSTHTVTTQSNGSFSISRAYGVGTWNFTISFDGDSNYTSSSVSRTVIVREHDYAISISADKPILSYSDGESCTVTAVLTDNSVFVAGETLNYVIKHGSTTISTGSDTTDSNGQISFTYASTGVGDVTVEVKFGSLLQETCGIQDCLKAWSDTWTQGSSNRQIALNFALPSSFKIEYKSKTTNYAQLIFGKTYQTLDYLINHRNNSSNMTNFELLKRVNSSTAQTVITTQNTYPASQTYDIEYRYDNGVHTLLVDGVQVWTVTDTSVEITHLLYWSIRDTTVSNLKVKAL